MKAFLVVLPLLCALQWLWRAYKGSKGIFTCWTESQYLQCCKPENWPCARRMVLGYQEGYSLKIGIAPRTDIPHDPGLSSDSHSKQRRRRMLRVVTRCFLGVVGLIQCALLLWFNLNGTHGGLLNFWLAFMLGAVFESLLGLDDIRGIFRQMLVAFVFIFI